MSFDDALREIRNLRRRVELLDGQHEIPVSEFFSDEFMLRHTDFQSAEAMFAASGFNVSSIESFNAIPDEAWDTFVRERTRFPSWKEMMAAAADEWVMRRLELG